MFRRGRYIGPLPTAYDGKNNPARISAAGPTGSWPRLLADPEGDDRDDRHGIYHGDCGVDFLFSGG